MLNVSYFSNMSWHGISSRVVRSCADQLCGVMECIFILSLRHNCIIREQHFEETRTMLRFLTSNSLAYRIINKNSWQQMKRIVFFLFGTTQKCFTITLPMTSLTWKHFCRLTVSLIQYTSEKKMRSLKLCKNATWYFICHHSVRHVITLK